MRRCSRQTGGYVIYAEMWDEEREIMEKGVFLSMAEFLPFRAKGWQSTMTINDVADDYLARAVEDDNFCPFH